MGTRTKTRIEYKNINLECGERLQKIIISQSQHVCYSHQSIILKTNNIKCTKWIAPWKILGTRWDVCWIFGYRYRTANEFVINRLHTCDAKKWCLHAKRGLNSMRQVMAVFEKNKRLHVNDRLKYRSLRKARNAILLRIRNFIEMHREH